MRTPSVLQTILIASLALTLGACEVGPDYTAPETQLPAGWVSDQDKAADAKAEIDQEWWQNFHDPILSQLIDKAAGGNFDLKIAEARIAEARAKLSTAYAALLPTGDIKGTANRQANELALPGGASNPFASLLKKPFNTFQTGFDASWEIDFFGGNQRAAEGANAQVQSAQASRDDVRVSLMAEVARTYVEIRAAQAQIAVANDTIASDQKTLSIAQQRFKAGETSGLDTAEADADLQQAQTQLPLYRNMMAQAEFSMDVLLGEQPGATRAVIDKDGPIPASDKKLVLAAPASVIAQRPDIRMAERNLAAATAQQGVAVANFFPKISLTGFFGALNTSASSLLQGGSESWMAQGGIIWPILSYGSLSATLDAANAQQQEAMASYQKTVITALADVEQSLNAYTEQQNFLQSAAAAVDKNRHARDIAQERYSAGMTSFLDVLEADRTLYTSQAQLAKARSDTSQDLIAVYKSLGGGWAKN